MSNLISKKGADGAPTLVRKKESKNKKLNIRLTEKEKGLLSKKAKIRGLSLTGYLLYLVSKDRPQPK